MLICSCSLQYVEDILTLSQHIDLEVAQRTFHFWYNLADVIDEQETASSGNHNVSMHSPYFDDYFIFFLPVRLLPALSPSIFDSSRTSLCTHSVVVT